MAQSRPKSNALLPTHHRHSKPSEDTNASGLAESAISYSAFPEPPSSIPPTPVRSVFGSPGSIASSSNRYSRSTFDRNSSRVLTSHPEKQEKDVNSVSASNISPYDWHEGASSIDVDATEDRLLPTSFITSLLQENAGPRAANRASYTSDAISGISEMTYPPRNPFTDSLRNSSAIPSHNGSRRQSHRGPVPRPVGGRPPNSFPHRGTARDSGSSNTHGFAQPALATQVRSHPDPGQTVTRDDSSIDQSTLITEQSEWNGKSGGKLPVYSEVDEADDSHPETQTNSSIGFATSQTNLAWRRPVPNANNEPPTRESVHSTRSVAPSLISRISSLRSFGKRAFTWRRKPLPPVPTIPHIPIAVEREHRRVEEQTPLPDLVNRANYLHGLLEKGHHPHQSISSHPAKAEQFVPTSEVSGVVAQLHSQANPWRPSASKKSRAVLWMKSNKSWVALGIFVVIATIAIGSAVGVTAQRNKVREAPKCPANVGGANCNLNATCVCTSPSSLSCEKPVGRAVLDVIPIMNKILDANLTVEAVYNGLWIAQGGVQGSSCVKQVELIDVGPVLDASHQPNRTQWTQSALLWTLTQTQDVNSVQQLQDFVRKVAWSQLPASDGPVTSTETNFAVAIAGFNYDLASQMITPLPATFKDNGQPLSEQSSRIDAGILPSLNHIYSYAVASSTQQDHALLQYWTNTLHQKEDNLEPFKAAFSTSPIILPFNATSQAIQSVYSANSFPPPAGCYPELDSGQSELIHAIEDKAFGLSQTTTATQFNVSCFPTHPTYGVLDILRLRLPFPESLGEVPRQGVILKPDVAPRAILAVGERLSALSGPTNATRGSIAFIDPRGYGTMTYANHIILEYLSSINSNTANAIITLEVSVFGSVEASDASSYVSSFADFSGSLFFGSNDGSAFRSWAIGRGGQIAWTENSTSLEVVYDKSLSDKIFNLTWAATSAGIETNAPNVGLVNITDTFHANQRFSP
ncbi:hypothetical protein AN958_04937 [Leucoagaricus sp. SymC.cos]|nr:hypothetical protein AN958_04937 [Leucoagaricus sp. SymC.cos]